MKYQLELLNACKCKESSRMPIVRIKGWIFRFYVAKILLQVNFSLNAI